MTALKISYFPEWNIFSKIIQIIFKALLEATTCQVPLSAQFSDIFRSKVPVITFFEHYPKLTLASTPSPKFLGKNDIMTAIY